MPIHEYKCEKCGCIFEQLIYRSDDTAVVCPNCQTQKVRKLLSSVSVMNNGRSGTCATGTAGAGRRFG